MPKSGRCCPLDTKPAPPARPPPRAADRCQLTANRPCVAVFIKAKVKANMMSLQLLQDRRHLRPPRRPARRGNPLGSLRDRIHRICYSAAAIEPVDNPLPRTMLTIMMYMLELIISCYRGAPRDVRTQDLRIDADDVRDALPMLSAFGFGGIPQLGRDTNDHNAGAARGRAG